MISCSSDDSVSPGLSTLPEVALDRHYQAIFEAAEKSCGAPRVYRHRLLSEAHDLLALCQLSGRLQVLWLDLAVGLRAKLSLEVPVPCLPDPVGPLQVARCALLGLLYPQEAIVMPLPGHAFVRILAPRPVWLGCVGPDANQMVCLGPSLPPGIPVIEIVLMTYGALSMQSTLINVHDPAGVANAEAAVWWQCPANACRIPLSREPFLRDEVPHVP